MLFSISPFPLGLACPAKQGAVPTSEQQTATRKSFIVAIMFHLVWPPRFLLKPRPLLTPAQAPRWMP